eukprot:gene820-583_t
MIPSSTLRAWGSRLSRSHGAVHLIKAVGGRDAFIGTRLLAAKSHAATKRSNDKGASQLPPSSAKQSSSASAKPTVMTPIVATSTVENVLGNLKAFGRATNVSKLTKMIEDANQHGLFHINVLKAALKTLQRIHQPDIGRELYRLFETTPTCRSELCSQPTNTSFLVKWFSQHEQMDVVESIWSHIGLVLAPDDLSHSCVTLAQQHFTDHPDAQEFHFLYHRELLTNATLGYATTKHFDASLRCLDTMLAHSMSIPSDTSKTIFRQFTKESTTAFAMKALHRLLELGGLQDQDALQMAVTAFVRQVDFVKGCVNIAGLPPEHWGEVAFIGRSNVGKSSLINAICNRKHVAYASKQAGKTTEFNYFLVSGVVGQETPKFYLIDLPGVGYAQRSKTTRSSWTKLMDRYTRERSTLRCIFHLIDSRHGVLDADDECFQLLETLPADVQYVVVFTKVDKLRGNNDNSRIHRGHPLSSPVSPAIYQGLRDRLKAFTTRDIPVLFSSSETKRGVLSVLNTALQAAVDVRQPTISTDTATEAATTAETSNEAMEAAAATTPSAST